MRYIHTSDARLEELRKQAKKLQRNGGGDYTELLEKVAKRSNYDHWHHVVECHGRGKASGCTAALVRDCETTIAAELRSEAHARLASPETGNESLVLFSTGVGDAWLLNGDMQSAMCLVWRGIRIEPAVNVDPSQLEINYHGHFELIGKFFHIISSADFLGDATIPGYPLDVLRPVLEKAKPFDLKFAEIFSPEESLELTPDVLSQLVRQGWPEDVLVNARSEGHRYSPARNSLLTSMVVSWSDDDLLE